MTTGGDTDGWCHIVGDIWGHTWAPAARHVGVAIFIVNINPKQWKLPQSRFRTSAGWSITRVPGAAQHEVMRCRPGPFQSAAVPDQRRTAPLRYALHRVRDTRYRQSHSSFLSRDKTSPPLGFVSPKRPLASFGQNASRSRVPGAAQHEVVRCRHRSRVYPRSALKCAQVG
jgi:hypothetical protein